MSSTENSRSECKPLPNDRFDNPQASYIRTPEFRGESDPISSSTLPTRITTITSLQYRIQPNTCHSKLFSSEWNASTHISLFGKSFDYGESDHLSTLSFLLSRTRTSNCHQASVNGTPRKYFRVKRHILSPRISYNCYTIPKSLCLLLDAYELCAHCASPCLLNFGELIVPKQLSANGVTVHVTAAQQSFAVPIQERYCSMKCFNYGLKRAGLVPS